MGEKLDFEQALQRLEQIVQELEGGEINLKRAITRFEEGKKLIDFCQEQLDAAEKKIEFLSGENTP